MLYSFQNSLPRLPVPAVKDTCKRVINTLVLIQQAPVRLSNLGSGSCWINITNKEQFKLSPGTDKHTYLSWSHKRQRIDNIRVQNWRCFVSQSAIKHCSVLTVSGVSSPTHGWWAVWANGGLDERLWEESGTPPSVVPQTQVLVGFQLCEFQSFLLVCKVCSFSQS